jgi:hypothetical protein
MVREPVAAGQPSGTLPGGSCMRETLVLGSRAPHHNLHPRQFSSTVPSGSSTLLLYGYVAVAPVYVQVAKLLVIPAATVQDINTTATYLCCCYSCRMCAGCQVAGHPVRVRR